MLIAAKKQNFVFSDKQRRATATLMPESTISDLDCVFLELQGN